jgi:hypothetical protein
MSALLCIPKHMENINLYGNLFWFQATCVLEIFFYFYCSPVKLIAYDVNHICTINKLFSSFPRLRRGKRGWLINSARALNWSFIKKQVMSQVGGVCFSPAFHSLESLSSVACVCITRPLVNTEELSHLHITWLYRLQKEARI